MLVVTQYRIIGCMTDIVQCDNYCLLLIGVINLCNIMKFWEKSKKGGKWCYASCEAIKHWHF